MPASYNLSAELVDRDLESWTGIWADAATIFGSIHREAPLASDFLAVVAPTWTKCIDAGGPMNPQHQQRRPSELRSTGGARAAGRPRVTGKPRPATSGYCFAFASKAGCPWTAQDCKWIHVLDPAKSSTGGGGRGSGGGGGTGATNSGSTTNRGGGGVSGRGGGGTGGGGNTSNGAPTRNNYGRGLSHATEPI